MKNDNIPESVTGVTSPAVVCNALLGSVFELSENDDRHDTYYTLGFFATLADAVAEVEKHGVQLCEVATDNQESACIEIHEHRFGLRLRGLPKWTRKWVYDYEREHGNRWQVCMPNSRITGTDTGVTH